MSPDTEAQLHDRSADTDLLGAIDLDVTGMTCAACASRIERKLNKLDGVHASVNYATERARVRLDLSRGDARDEGARAREDHARQRTAVSPLSTR